MKVFCSHKWEAPSNFFEGSMSYMGRFCHRCGGIWKDGEVEPVRQIGYTFDE